MPCIKCGLDEKHFGVQLDAAGLCSYCNLLTKYSDIISKIGHQEALFRERIALLENTGEYDCLVGFSGGKDSSYIIYKLKSQYGVRVLAYTCDNGFLNDYAKDNIDALIQELGIDHRWIRPNKEVLQEMFTNNLRSEGWPCSACFHMIEASAWKLAFEKRIPFIIGGRTPEQLLRQPDETIFEGASALLRYNFAEHDPKRIQEYALHNLNRIEQNKRNLLPGRHLWPLAEKTLYLSNDYRIPNDFVPEWISFFLYEKHNEGHIIHTLEEETRWIGPDKKDPLSHADCAAHDAASFLFRRTHGHTLLDLEVCSSIRLHKLSPNQGRQVLEDERRALKHYPRQSLRVLADTIGMSPTKLRMLPMKIRARKWLKGILHRGE